MTKGRLKTFEWVFQKAFRWFGLCGSCEKAAITKTAVSQDTAVCFWC